MFGLGLVITKSSKKGMYKKQKRQDWDHIMVHQVLYIVQLPNEEGDMHLVRHDMPCDPNLVSSAPIPIFPF